MPKLANPHIGTTEWLRVGDLSLDSRVNRGTERTRSHIEKIKREFDPNLVGIIQVSKRRDGAYLVIDGQHRCIAIKEMWGDDERVECKIHEGLALAEEAARVRGLNNTRRFSALEDFLKGVTAGDPECIAVNKIVQDAHLVIDDQSSDGHITAIGALLKIYRGEGSTTTKANGKALIQTLNVVQRSWGRVSAALQGSLLHGVGLVILRYGDQLDLDALVTKLGPVPGGPNGVLARAKQMREIRGGTVPKAVAGTVVDLYNKGRRNGSLGDWWS